MDTYSVTITVSNIPEDQYDEIVSEIETDIKMHGVEVHVGVGEPE